MYVIAYYDSHQHKATAHTFVGEQSPSVLKKKKSWKENSKRNGEISSVLGKETLTLKTVSASGYDYNNDYI